MTQQSWESPDPFRNTAEFASTATVRPVVGDPFTVRGIFDDPYLNSQLGEYELDTSRPRLTCKWSDIAEITRGATVELDGRTYDVLTNAQPDGTGMGLLDMALQRT